MKNIDAIGSFHSSAGDTLPMCDRVGNALTAEALRVHKIVANCSYLGHWLFKKAR